MIVFYPKWSKARRFFITTAFHFALEYGIRKVHEDQNSMGYISFWLMLMM
jgi:hypothetical protein